jgi:hypothetical protein
MNCPEINQTPLQTTLRERLVVCGPKYRVRVAGESSPAPRGRIRVRPTKWSGNIKMIMCPEAMRLWKLRDRSHQLAVEALEALKQTSSPEAKRLALNKALYAGQVQEDLLLHLERCHACGEMEAA